MYKSDGVNFPVAEHDFYWPTRAGFISSQVINIGLTALSPDSRTSYVDCIVFY
jgi:hypothetical protein